MKMSKGIAKECKICVVGRMSPDGMSILCPKKGIMNPEDRCFHFKYDPLKRVPKKKPKLQEHSADEFSL